MGFDFSEFDRLIGEALDEHEEEDYLAALAENFHARMDKLLESGVITREYADRAEYELNMTLHDSWQGYFISRGIVDTGDAD